MMLLRSAPVRAALLVCLGSALIVAPRAHAQSTSDEGWFGAKTTTAEAPVTYPGAPKDLVHVHITASGSLQFYVDQASVSVEPGQTVRYTLVGKTPNGPSNITYEGINCATRQWKLYAVWNDASKQWVMATASEWQRIPENGAARVHSTLYRDDFCHNQSVRGSAADLVRRIELGLHAPSSLSN